MRNKKKILIIVAIIWSVLWLFFIIREDKDGQYVMLRGLYSVSGTEKTRVLYGPGLYDFFMFCRDNIPAELTYDVQGFEKYSINEVRARYLLYPLKMDRHDPDVRIVYGTKGVPPEGYREFKSYDNGVKGCLYIKKGIRI